nr:MAG TPA: hypothetical protein [Caudoviricetes sp.]
MALLRRKSGGYDTDQFVFRVNGHTVKRYYGDRYTDEQAVFILLKEIERGIAK